MSAPMHLLFSSGLSTQAFMAVKTGVVIPLALSCLVLIVVLPAAAWRGKLSVPIYALLALASGIVAFAAGTLAGAKAIHGTPIGVVISLIFFLLVATAVGCFLSVLFYRQAPVAGAAAAEEKQDVLSPPKELER